MSKFVFKHYSTMSFRLITGLIILLLQAFLITAQNLQDTIITLEGIEVKDKALQFLHPVTHINKEILERSAVVDIGEILRAQPNISGIRRGGFAIDPVVRGLRNSQVNIFLDEGIHIEGGCPNRMDPVLAHISSEDIMRLEIVHGPYLLRYGPSLGSSIKIITRHDNPFTRRQLQASSLSSFDANRNGLRQHLVLKGSNNNIYYRAAGGYADYGNYSDGQGKEWKTAFRKYGFSTDAGFRLKTTQQFDLSYKGSFARDVMFPALPMDESADNTHILSAVYTLKDPWQPDNFIRISGYYTSVYHEMDNSRRPQYSAVVPPLQGIMQAIAKVDTRSAGARIAGQRMHKSLKIEGGFDVSHIYKDGNRFVKMIMIMDGQEYINERTVNLWREANSLNSGLFAGLSSKPGLFEFSATLRTDLSYSTSADTLFIEKEGRIYYDAKPTTDIFWSMGVSGMFHLSEKLRFTLGLGRGVRPPDLSERYIQFLATGFDRYDYLGNPGLKPEVNYQTDIMLNYTSSRFNFYCNLFRADIRNFITGQLLPPAVARPQSMGAPGVKRFQNIDRAVFYGFEAGITGEPLQGFHTSFTTGYTYAYFPEIEKILLENGQAVGTEILQNDPIPEMPAFESLVKLSYMFLGNRLEPSVEIRAVAAQKLVSEASYEASTPGYVISGFGISWMPLKAIRLTAGVSNLFNKAYYEHLNRRIIGSGENFHEPGRTMFLNLKIVL